MRVADENDYDNLDDDADDNNDDFDVFDDETSHCPAKPWVLHYV